MQEVTGSIPVFSTKKALYFAESMVLFFLLKPILGGCIASPAPFSGFCRRFLYNPQLLTLHHAEERKEFSGLSVKVVKGHTVVSRAESNNEIKTLHKPPVKKFIEE